MPTFFFLNFRRSSQYQRWIPRFGKGGRGLARSRRRPLGLFCGSGAVRESACGAHFKVFVHLFQKAADSKGGALGRHPQMAERPML